MPDKIEVTPIGHTLFFVAVGSILGWAAAHVLGDYAITVMLGALFGATVKYTIVAGGLRRELRETRADLERLNPRLFEVMGDGSKGAGWKSH